MDLNLILQFIKPETLTVAIACYALGMFLKSSRVKDWLIPFVLLIFSIVLTVVYVAFVLGDGFTGKVIVSGIVQGIFAAALAVYGNQLIKQAAAGKTE